MLEKMLFPTDLSESNLKILSYIHDLKNAGVEEVGILFVINLTKLSDVSGGIDIENYIEEESKKAEEEVKPIAEAIKGRGIKVEVIRPFPAGDPVAEILQCSKDYDFIAMNSRGASVFKKILLGSVSEGVLKASKKPVYVFKFDNEDDRPAGALFSKILVPYDFSKHADKALEYAEYVAKRVESEIHLLHVVEPECEDGDLERVAEGLRQKGLKVFAHTQPGVPHKVILRRQEELGATTIFMGSRGVSVVRSLLLGSTSDSIIRRSPVPVFVCKAPEEE